MKTKGSIQCHQTEKAIIDALLKISEIIQKTEMNREDQKSKLTLSDGDCNNNNHHHLQQQVPIPPPIRTLDSYMTSFNHQTPSNCNQTSIHKQKQYSSKRSYYDIESISSLSDDHYRKKSSVQSNKNPPINQEVEKIDIHNDQQSEKCFKNHLLSSIKLIDENPQQKIYLSTLIKSDIEKLLDQFDSNKQIYNIDHYEKQCELAILASKQGNYTLSYSIYTTLLYDNQYDYKFKSDILSYRARILLLNEKYFESIDDCTQAIALNQWNKLAYIVRATCWMLKQEYFKAVNDYSKIFHFFDQTQQILDLLNIAYEKYQLSNNHIEQDDDRTLF